MNGQTLQALRGFLFFSVPEAARLIAQVQERTWRYWESGDRAVPNDVASTIDTLLDMRERMLGELEKTINQNGADNSPFVLVFYPTLEDWMTQSEAEPIHWRLHCSVVAEIAANYDCELIKFHAVKYQAWLGGKVDSHAMRGMWAALQE